MANVVYLEFSVQEEDILEHISAKCHYLHFNQLVHHYVT